MSTAADDARWMARAIGLARRGLGTTRPNPAVGCVLVRDARCVGEGWHRRAGEAHAEVLALRQAGAAARGATCYVSLEPCAHHGRTPPCTDALLEAGVARVVAAMADPDPRVAGGGLARLEAAGVRIECGLMAAAAEAVNPGFVMRMRAGRPYVRIKLAASLDGRTAMASGESRWISSAAARRDVHRLRARSGAVLTGIGTVLADDPRLGVRDAPLDEALEPPLRAIADTHLRLAPGARLFQVPGPVLVFTCANESPRYAALQARGAQIVRLPAGAGGVDPLALLRWLAAQRQVNEVLVEAGPALAGTLLRAGLADELIVYLAPRLLGAAARALIDVPGCERLAEAPALRFTDARRVGPDLRLTAVPVAHAEPGADP